MNNARRQEQGLRLIQTCAGCPEQYDVFQGDMQVGYLRLRNGHFRAEVPDCGGKVVYTAYPHGDGLFDSSDEREYHIGRALAAIEDEMRQP